MPKPIRTTRAEPPGGATDARYAGATLLDSFSVRLPSNAPDDAYTLARLSLSDPPVPFRVLMGLRNAIMARFGVKTSGEIRSGSDEQDHIEFFPVLRQTPREVELGAEDRHLDFRTWLTIEGSGADRHFASTTAATAHNLLGRSYLAIIGPFHVAIVRASLRRLVVRLRGDPPSRTSRSALPGRPRWERRSRTTGTGRGSTGTRVGDTGQPGARP